ncbi:gamma-glutamyl-gamma-aminobutyrate hydrolase family protein [Shewanella sp. NIFS-20-20]|uniref:gamma-glutamyl-gamma-aminobutyrate hydrolase family protein n=1 Tax=Shewanella sp. NIFS-20-20 TaxID=2853806 RepID=UPI001C4549E9|nr:gamma-glutamyl-gamma-aminobutyrate hydrolase family protein [Shewanella sp. NIFS-20-20]MBV7317316.1 gamma-glutamyl-gamma-aminobutyrate hydrolase family protein [Shewanella sp. NIFS-20-20]
MLERSIAFVGVTACNQRIGLQDFAITGHKYLRGIIQGTDAWPVIIPSLGADIPMSALLNRLDGILFTGSPSNVEPHHYQGNASTPGTLHDPLRDATTLPLLKLAIDMGIPVLAICRGFQEMNVVYGGSLHQKIHEVPSLNDHREDKTAPMEIQYGLAHTVTLEPGGLLFQGWGRTQAEVNSVHTQGVDRLGLGLRPEAYADDGLIEAFSVEHAKNFALGVQWHPEWQIENNPFYKAIFSQFGAACNARVQQRNA